MMKLLELPVAIVSKFPKFFIALLVLVMVAGPVETHHVLAVLWNDVTTVITGHPVHPSPANIKINGG